MSSHEIIENAIETKNRIGQRIPMTEDEFRNWHVGEHVRAEWVNGFAIVMSQANREHADLNGWLIGVLRSYVEAKGIGKILGPEFTVRLGLQHRRRVPDVVYVAHDRLERLTDTHLEGAADLIVEIVSPDSISWDWREKYFDYEASGVREYWVIDPMSRHVEVHVLHENGTYQRQDIVNDTIVSHVLSGLWIRVQWLWPEARPKIVDTLRELGVL